MARGARAGAEASGRLDHDIDTELRPGQPAGIVLREDGDPRLADPQRALRHRDQLGKAAVDGVVAQERGERAGVRDVVDRDDLDVRVAHVGRA